MADINEVASFGIDTSKAVAELNKYIAQLSKLDAELKQLQKEGKDTSQVQAQIAKTTRLATQALNENTNAANKNAAAQNKSGKAIEGSATGYARAAGRIKSFGGAAAFGAASLGNLTGAIGLSGFAMGALVGFAEKAFSAITALLFPIDQVNVLSKELAATFVQQGVAVTAAFDAVDLANVGTKERAAAIDALNAEYGKYLPNLLTEKSSTDEIAAAYVLVNEAILQNILIKAKATKQEELITKRIQATIDAEQARNATTRFAALANIKAIDKEFIDLDRVFTKVENSLRKADTNFTTATIQSELKKAKDQLKELQNNFGNRALNPVAYDSAVNELTLKIGRLFKVEEARIANIQRNADKAKTSIQKEKAEYIVLEGSLADLEAKLARVNKLIAEQVNPNDVAALAVLGEQYNVLTAQVEQAKKTLDELKNAPAKLEVIDIQTIDVANQRLNELKGELQNLELTNIDALTAVEKERNKAIQGVAGNRQQQEAINIKYDAIRLAAEQQQERAILQLKLRILQGTKDKTDADLQEIAQIKLKLEELNKIQVGQGLDIAPAKSKLQSLKDTALAIADGIGQLSSQLLQFAQQNVQSTISELDAAISKQEEAYNKLLDNQNNANVQQVQLERDRLEALQEARAKAKDKELLLIQLQIAANAALAIAKAAAEGGGIASAITIGIALAAMAIGFAQAKAQSEQSFFEGTAYAQLNGSPKGRDTIAARINEGEAVIPTSTNARYKSAVLSIYNETIPASLLNSVAENYKNGQLDISQLKGVRVVGFSDSEKRTLSVSSRGGSGKFNENRIIESVREVVTAIVKKKEVVIINNIGGNSNSQKYK